MKKSPLCSFLLFACLLPCAAQARHGSLRAHAAPRRLAPAVKAVRPEAASVSPKAVRPVIGGPFPDVPPDHWAAAAVETLRERGIVVGYPAAKPSAVR